MRIRPFMEMTAATGYFVCGNDRLARITVSSTVPLAKIQPDEATYFLYDHLGNTRVAFRVDGSNVPTIINALDYYSYGKVLREYDNGAGNPNSKDFTEARKEGIESLMALGGVNTAISAVIGSVNGGKDPTNGSRAWLGAPSANKYVESADNKKEGAVFQFSFKSENGYHSFYKK